MRHSGGGRSIERKEVALVRTRLASPAIALLAAIAVACSASGEPGPTAGGASAATTSPPAATGPATSGPSAEPSAEPTVGTSARTRFAGRISAIPAALEAELEASTWHPGCPVPLEDLRLLQFNYVGFDGEIKRGPMIVNASVAEDVLWVFEQLFDAGFALKRVGLAREFHERRWEEQPNSRRSVTASFNCRVVITPAGPGTEFSQHSYGLAVDVNPLQNPFVREDGWVRNRYARPFVDRSGEEPGMIHDGDVVVTSFAAIGWSWGGRWSGGKDYMHFSLLGR
jgi:poly-gamma-glutamate synthesis protein (capsule biosynthesis protein)